MKAPFKADGNALGLKYRQHNDVWKHDIRLQLFVDGWGINMVPGHSEILDLMIKRGSLGHRERARAGQGFLENLFDFKASDDLL